MTDTAETTAARESLENLFARFTDASSKLEQRYEALLLETEELRRQLNEKDQEIKRTERLSVLGETAAAIAHEIRNPLGSIKLFVSLLGQDIKKANGSLEYVREIEKNMNRLDAVINNILHFSKEQPPKLAPSNINTLIQEQILQLQHSGFQQVEFKTEFNANPFCLASSDGLRQVFANVLRNAAQAVSAEGNVSIQTLDAGPDILISIQDTGPGITEDMISKIFDPFASTKPEGTGLGLAIVKRVIDQHAGTVHAFNRDNGAEFQIRLPRRQK